MVAGGSTWFVPDVQVSKQASKSKSKMRPSRNRWVTGIVGMENIVGREGGGRGDGRDGRKLKLMVKHSLGNSEKGGGTAVLLVPVSSRSQPLYPHSVRRAGREKTTTEAGGDRMTFRDGLATGAGTGCAGV